MKTIDKELPKRFTEAVTKLYNAFHNNELQAYSCKACAVGNMCDNDSGWAQSRKQVFADWDLNNPIGIQAAKKSNYSLIDLKVIEDLFVSQFDGLETQKDKDRQFKGLCAVIEHLCELDNIPNIMDYQSLFETNEKSEPKKQLNFN